MFDSFDVVIMVNGTNGPTAPRCHWIAAVDSHSLVPVFARLVNPQIGIISQMIFADNARDKGLQWVEAELYAGRHCDPAIRERDHTTKCRYTLPSALWFAREQAGEFGTIEIFGLDCAVGQPDCDGSAGDHSAARFRADADWLRSIWSNAVVAVHGDISDELLTFIVGDREAAAQLRPQLQSA
jgi:hypothetical protein